MDTPNHIPWAQRSAFTLAIASILLCACNNTKPPADLPTVDNVADHPDLFVGKRVSLSGELDNIYSNLAFELEEPGFPFTDEVLVLTRKPVQLGAVRLKEDMLVSVSGTVEKLTIGKIEKELGRAVLPELKLKWKDKAILIADRVEGIQSFAEWSEKDEPEGMLVSMWAIQTVTPELDLAGAKITLENVRVAERDKMGLWVGTGGLPDLFVVPKDGASLPKVDPGRAVKIRGVLERMPAKPASEFHLDDGAAQRAEDDLLYLRADAISAVEEKTSAHSHSDRSAKASSREEG